MTKFGDLITHAERCDQLASVCTDRTIARKLQLLADEYRDIAEHSTVETPVLIMRRCPMCGASEPCGPD